MQIVTNVTTNTHLCAVGPVHRAVSGRGMTAGIQLQLAALRGRKQDVSEGEVIRIV